MCVKPKWLKKISIPDFYLCGRSVDIVSSQKYLGVLITDVLNDNDDIQRHVKGIYARGNMLVKKFMQCSYDVKVKLFKAYCNSFYCGNLWCNFSKATLRKVKTAYNRVFRSLMAIKDVLMTNRSMLEYAIDPLDVVQRKSIFSLRKRVMMSSNSIIMSIISSMQFNTSQLCIYWQKVLFSL